MKLAVEVRAQISPSRSLFYHEVERDTSLSSAGDDLWRLVDNPNAASSHKDEF